MVCVDRRIGSVLFRLTSIWVLLEIEIGCSNDVNSACVDKFVAQSGSFMYPLE